jgi:hypothetical protein
VHKPSEPVTDFSMTGITEPGIVDHAPAEGLVICRLIVLAAGTAGRLVLNDARWPEFANTSNIVFSVPFKKLKLGVLELFRAVDRGICISAMPKGGRIALSYGIARASPVYMGGGRLH